MVTAQAVVVNQTSSSSKGTALEFRYSTTSFAGVAELRYKPGRNVSFRGDQLKVERTQLGQMVTVALNNDPQAIGSVETLTLMIPAIPFPPTRARPTCKRWRCSA